MSLKKLNLLPASMLSITTGNKKKLFIFKKEYLKKYLTGMKTNFIYPTSVSDSTKPKKKSGKKRKLGKNSDSNTRGKKKPKIGAWFQLGQHH